MGPQECDGFIVRSLCQAGEKEFISSKGILCQFKNIQNCIYNIRGGQDRRKHKLKPLTLSIGIRGSAILCVESEISKRATAPTTARRETMPAIHSLFSSEKRRVITTYALNVTHAV